jgi:N-acetylglutamate synthase-like GNAT family acetyltransferase
LTLQETVATARIRRAETADAAALTALARTSKAAWGYDAAFMAACRAELTVGARDIRRDLVYLIERDGQVVGFYRLRVQGTLGEVAMMFVAPDVLGAGIGRRLWAHLEEVARQADVTRLEVDSDPHAEGFYRARGMQRIGEAPSGSIPGRRLPRLAKPIGVGAISCGRNAGGGT